MNKPKLYIVVPCYNESAVLPVTAPMFKSKIETLIIAGKISSESKVLFVNDGSKDRTWDIIRTLASENCVYEGISLSRNRGHQNALLAGLMEVKDKCDISISIDCDGQQDINAMDKMIDEYLGGAEIVYGIRNTRNSDSFFKKFTALGYYSLLRKLGGEVIPNHADYRLLSSKVLKELANFREVNIFLRGIIPLLGFKSTCVYFDCVERVAGKSHYTLDKMVTLALDGITSLSVKPIRMIISLGAFFSFFSFCVIIYVLVSYFGGKVVPGWASIVISVCMIGGIQLISLGIVGEYVGKIYMETKARPRYIISERTDNYEK